jgi:transcriptional regulator with GAF, ATPase, and Fis domain
MKDRIQIDEKEFFRNATLRICSSLEIEKALWQCLLYIQDFIPVSMMALHLYEQASGVAETVAHASPEGCKAMSIKSPISEKGRRQAEAQRSIRIRRIDKVRDDAVTAPVSKPLGGLDLAALVMDLVIEGKFLGVVTLHGKPGTLFNTSHEHLLSLLNEPFAIAFTNYIRFRELEKIKDLLVDNNQYLQNELRRISGEDVIGAEFGLRGVMELVRQVAPTESPVLLLGETGVGKELIAGAVHNFSSRREGPFIKVNCGAIPETLMDSELFGHEKGAFTGANTRKLGRFERADGGTIFLDEIGELSLEAQVRLLRVLQDKEIERVGGTEIIPINLRVIAATHRDLEKMMAQGRFRDDLYYRLKVFPILIPPLRNRASDIPALVQHFIQKKVIDMKLAAMPSLSPGAVDRLLAYHWPGNVRELENAVERALIQNKDGVLTFGEISQPDMDDSSHFQVRPDTGALLNLKSMSLDRAMASHIKHALKFSKGKVEGKGGAAEILEINPRTLRHRMKKLGVPFGRKAKKSVQD